MKELISFLHQVFRLVLQNQSTSQLLLDDSKTISSIITVFIKVQMKQWFPIRSQEEMELYTLLLEMVIEGIQIPFMKGVMELLSCIPLLMPVEERGKNIEQE